MTLEERCAKLPHEKKFMLAIACLRRALPLWDTFAEKDNRTYNDSIVGMEHTIAHDLPNRALAEAEKSFLSNQPGEAETIKKLIHEFTEPVVALQDGDWELPNEVLKTFYSAYNLIEALGGEKTTVFKEETVYVSVNQSVDALLSSNTYTIDEIQAIIVSFEN